MRRDGEDAFARPEESGDQQRIDRIVGLFGTGRKELATRRKIRCARGWPLRRRIGRECPIVLEAFVRDDGKRALQLEREVVPRVDAGRAFDVAGLRAGG